jgi:hypothetical protein
MQYHLKKTIYLELTNHKPKHHVNLEKKTIRPNFKRIR